MRFEVVLFLVFVVFLADSFAFAQLNSDSNILQVSFVNNVSPSYTLEFDSNKKILLEQSYSWVRDDTSRYNLISYSIDGEEFVPISRQPRGTFSIDIPTGTSSIVFLSVVQFPVAIEGVKDYTFSPKSPTNDNWFDEKSEILIHDITSDESTFPQKVIVNWDGPIINNTGNSVQILVDSPVHLEAYWDTDNFYLGFLVLVPIVGVLALFVKRKSGSNLPKTTSKQTLNAQKQDSNSYDDEINDFLKQKSTEKLDLLLSSDTITPEKYTRIKEIL